MDSLVLAPYFTRPNKYHQHDSTNGGKGGSRPDDYELIKPWYESVKRLGLSARIFHNELSDGFVETYETENLQFVYWGETHRPSYNDERFYAYYTYLLDAEVSEVFLTDLYDVEFMRDPFSLVASNPDAVLFCGSEQITPYSGKWMRQKCRAMDFPFSRDNYRTGNTLYNAGIIGGKKDPLMKLLKCMLGQMNGIDQKHNSNMPVFNWCVEQSGFPIFYGHPLHNVFKSFVSGPETYIKHK